MLKICMLILTFFLFSCGPLHSFSSISNCADDNTVETVLGIIKKELDTEGDTYRLKWIVTTSISEFNGAHECEARLVINDKVDMDIEYSIEKIDIDDTELFRVWNFR